MFDILESNQPLIRSPDKHEVEGFTKIVLLRDPNTATTNLLLADNYL